MNLYPTSDQPSVDPHRIEMVVSNVFLSTPISIEPAMGGTSTTVYRISYPHEIFYLRLLPDRQDSFAPEAAIHDQLRQRHVKVPEVIHFEHFNKTLQRSVMITTAIAGSPVIQQSQTLSEATLQAIVSEAGHDLALINSIAVDGFGWLRSQNMTEQLVAPYHTHKTFVLANWDRAFQYLANNVLSTPDASQLEQILVRYASWLECKQGYLTHGDFSCRHIFQQDGHYTGIIDFGDSRGTNGWYDLAYFHMRDGGPLLHTQLEPALLHGYNEINPLPEDYGQHIRFNSILITVHALADNLQKQPPDRFTEHQLRTLRHDIAALF